MRVCCKLLQHSILYVCSFYHFFSMLFLYPHIGDGQAVKYNFFCKRSASAKTNLKLDCKHRIDLLSRVCTPYFSFTLRL